MSRSFLALSAGLLILSATATAHAQPVLTAKQKAEIRKDARSLMGWQVRLYQGRNPQVRTKFTPLPGGKVAVQADMIARWRDERGVQASESGEIKLLPGGKWSWSGSAGYSRLTPSRSPAANVAQRASHVDNAVVVQRKAGKAAVLYSATDRGDELRIATIDTETRRLVALSGNLAAAPMRAAVKAHAKRSSSRPNNVVLGPLSKSGRSVEVKVYWPVNAGMSTDFQTTYRVALDAKGKPTGAVSEIEQRYVR